MKPWPIAAASAAILASFGGLSERVKPLPPPAANLPAARGSANLEPQCPEHSLPDNGVCIPVPARTSAEEALFGRRSQDWLPRRPDRPNDHAAYVYPVDLGGRPSAVDEKLSHISAETLPSSVSRSLTGVLVSAPASAAVRVPALEDQQGPAKVVYQGDLVGPTLITRHRVGPKETPRDYLVILGNLSEPPALANGATVAPDVEVGRPGSSVTPTMLAVYVETRLVRPEFDPADAPPESLLDGSNTIGVDPRNVLSLRASAKGAAR